MLASCESSDAAVGVRAPGGERDPPHEGVRTRLRIAALYENTEAYGYWVGGSLNGRRKLAACRLIPRQARNGNDVEVAEPDDGGWVRETPENLNCSQSLSHVFFIYKSERAHRCVPSCRICTGAIEEVCEDVVSGRTGWRHASWRKTLSFR